MSFKKNASANEKKNRYSKRCLLPTLTNEVSNNNQQRNKNSLKKSLSNKKDLKTVEDEENDNLHDYVMLSKIESPFP